jgi:hypothetical protein
VKRVWILAGAFVVTAAILVLALGLGSLGFDIRRYPLHDRRMQRVLEQHPTVEQLTQGLADDGSPLIADARTPAEIDRVIAAHGDDRGAALREKARKWDRLRVYAAGDMLYFVFFDRGGIMQDFALVSR